MNKKTNFLSWTLFFLRVFVIYLIINILIIGPINSIVISYWPHLMPFGWSPGDFYKIIIINALPIIIASLISYKINLLSETTRNKIDKILFISILVFMMIINVIDLL